MKLKVCGMKFRQNIREVLALKPDYIGFIFYKKSKRWAGQLFPEFARQITGVQKVGVFVNAPEEEILEKVESYQLDLVQLHGEEPAAFCQALRERVPVMKTLAVGQNFDFGLLERYANSVDYFLFDTQTNQYGGSGQTFDWSLLKEQSIPKPFFISGGLGVQEVLVLRNQFPEAYGLDVNSRFESEPGVKKISELKKIFKHHRP